MGQYLEGLPRQKQSFPARLCGITEDYFVFRQGTKGDEIGRISRNSVTDINIEKREDQNSRGQIKKPQYYCLEINWDDYDIVKQRAIFKFT